MMQLQLRFAVCAALLTGAFFNPGIADAHVTGASFSATTSPYVVDIGYDPVTFTAGLSQRFDFLLRNEKTGAAVPFDQVWLRVKKGSETLLATGIFKQPLGPTTLLYVFAQPGAYTVEPSFRDAQGNEIAVASFPITVAPGEGGPYLLYGVLVVAGAVCGVLLAALFSRIRNARRS